MRTVEESELDSNVKIQWVVLVSTREAAENKPIALASSFHYLHP